MTRRWIGAVVACLVAALPVSASDWQVQVAETALWAPLLSTIGVEATTEPARFRILVGDEPAASELGFVATADSARIASLVDVHDESLPIYWQQPLETPVFRVPSAARVFTQEKRIGAPLVAGLDNVLWVAVPPGETGYERFPYLLHALFDLGLQPPFRGDRLWAFFDSSYRLRADPDYLARQWRESGITALHVAAWHDYDADPEKAAYLRRLIEACRREGVLVYAWLELPHVSEGFWKEHPECREKTATLQDAKLDWRKLINLEDPKCAAMVTVGVQRLLTSFDWDGVNLGELYFESLHGAGNPARFTPLNDDVRAAAKVRIGFDPVEFFDAGGARHWSKQPEAWRAFLDYRAELALQLQETWLQTIRDTLPDADLVVTQIDDQFDPSMRDLLGADAARLLPLAEAYDFTLLVEDPAPLWSLGPERYPEIARRYQALAASPQRLAIDVNIVARYQQTYPTRKQTGGELLQLVDRSSHAFARVALYFENSIAAADRKLLPYAAAAARIIEQSPEQTIAEGLAPFGVIWEGFAQVDGGVWPIANRETVWLPAGRHRVEPAATPPPGRVLRLAADLLDAKVCGDAVAFRYRSGARAVALLDRQPSELLIDGAAAEPDLAAAKRHWSLRLPRGEHEITLRF